MYEYGQCEKVYNIVERNRPDFGIKLYNNKAIGSGPDWARNNCEDDKTSFEVQVTDIIDITENEDVDKIDLGNPQITFLEIGNSTWDNAC